MAKNTGSNFRKGAVKSRSQVLNPKTSDWTKRDAESGRFIAVKDGGKPFKGVSKER